MVLKAGLGALTPYTSTFLHRLKIYRANPSLFAGILRQGKIERCKIALL
jgi:hypothetical protein